MATRHDHPRLRAGRGYRKVGFFPISHHIPESAAFFFIGWATRECFALERTLVPKAPLPDWLVLLWALLFAILTYRSAPRWQRQFNLPEKTEPAWHLWLVIVVLDVFLLLGYFVPWPDF